MVYEDRDEIDLAEEDRLYEQDRYEAAEFSDTFREQLGESDADEDQMSEDETTMGSAPMTDDAPSEMESEDFGETVAPAASGAEGDASRETGFEPSQDELDEE